MTSEPLRHTFTSSRIVDLSRVLFAALVWATGFGIPATTRGDPEAAILQQQILNNRKQQDLSREQGGYRQRSQSTTPADQPRLEQRLRQQRIHQKQLQRRQIQSRQFSPQQGQAQPGDRGSNRNRAESLRYRRAQESQRLQFKLQRRTWRYR